MPFSDRKGNYMDEIMLDASQFDKNVKSGDSVGGSWQGTVVGRKGDKIMLKLSSLNVDVANQAESEMRSMAGEGGMMGGESGEGMM